MQHISLSNKKWHALNLIEEDYDNSSLLPLRSKSKTKRRKRATSKQRKSKIGLKYSIVQNRWCSVYKRKEIKDEGCNPIAYGPLSSVKFYSLPSKFMKFSFRDINHIENWKSGNINQIVITMNDVEPGQDN